MEYQHRPPLTRLAHNSCLPGDLMEHLADPFTPRCIDTALRNYGIPLRDKTPSSGNGMTTYQLIPGTYTFGQERMRNRISGSNPSPREFEYVGDCAHVAFPNLYVWLILHLHREGKVCDSLGALANLILTNPKPQPKDEYWLLRLFINAYKDPSFLWERYAHVEAWVSELFSYRRVGWVGVAEETQEASFSIAERPDFVRLSLERAMAAYAFTVTPHKGFLAEFTPRYVDEFGWVLGYNQLWIEDFSDRVATRHRRQKLGVLANL